MDAKEFNINSHIKQFAKGAKIFSEGMKGRDMFVILKGEVEVTQMINNEPRVLKKMKVGDFFGEMSTIRGLPRVATASALGAVECLKISPDTFKTMIQHKPGFGIKVIKELCNRVEAGNKEIEKLSLLNKIEKIIVVLVNFVTHHGKKPFTPQKILYTNVLSELLSKTNSDQATVGNIIVTLARYGKIEVIEEAGERYVNITRKLLD